jgi:hypothetical protein
MIFSETGARRRPQQQQVRSRPKTYERQDHGPEQVIGIGVIDEDRSHDGRDRQNEPRELRLLERAGDQGDAAATEHDKPYGGARSVVILRVERQRSNEADEQKEKPTEVQYAAIRSRVFLLAQ